MQPQNSKVKAYNTVQNYISFLTYALIKKKLNKCSDYQGLSQVYHPVNDTKSRSFKRIDSNAIFLRRF